MTYRVSLSTAAGRARAHALIDRAPDSWMCEVREATRSDAQNAAMWAMLHDVAVSKPGGRSRWAAVAAS